MNRPGADDKQPEVASALREAGRGFLDYLTVERGSSPLTVDAYKREINRYLRFLASEGIRTPDQVRPTDVGSALKSRSDTGISASTLHRALAAIRHFHKFCVRDGLAERDPAALIDGPKRGKSLPKALSSKDVVSIIEAASGARPADIRDRAMLEVLYGAGLRVSELVGLDVDDVDTSERSLRARGKGDKDRVVPFGTPAAEAVRRYLTEARPSLMAKSRGTPAMFVSSRGARLSRQTAWKVVKKYATAALGEARVHPHVLRHSFATHLVAGGADIRVVQEALGHARLSTTQVYTLVSRQTLKDVIESAHPRGNKRRPPAAPKS